MSERGMMKLRKRAALLPRAGRDRLDTVSRLRRAERLGKPLTVAWLRAIGLTPKGTRSSTGRKPWTQLPPWHRWVA